MNEGENDVPLGTARLRDLAPDDLAALFAAVLKRLPVEPPLPPPAPPSGSITGSDAKTIIQHPDADIEALQRVVGILLMAQGMTREQIITYVGEKIAPFLDDDEINGNIRKILYETLDDLHLPLGDPKERAASIEAARRLREFADEKGLVEALTLFGRVLIFLKGLSKKVIGALIVAAFYEIMRRMGVKDLPAPPGLGE